MISQSNRISFQSLGEMFDLVGIKPLHLWDSLRKMGNKHIRYDCLRERWSPHYPTIGNAYVVSEFIHRYVDPETIPFTMKDPRGFDEHEQPGYNPQNRKFLKNASGTAIIDLCADEFVEFESDFRFYSDAVHAPFDGRTRVRDKGVVPTKAARTLAELMKYNPDEYYAIR